MTHSNSNLRSGRFLFVCSTPGWCCRIGPAAFVLWRVGVLQHLGARADPGFWNGRWIFVIMSEKSNRIYFNIWGIRKKRKKEAQKKGGENSPISPPLDPPLLVAFFQPSFIIQWAPLWCCQTCCRPWTKIYWRPHSSCVMVLCALHSSLVQSASESWPSGSVMGMFRSATRQLEPSCGLSIFVTVRPRSFLRSLVRGPLCTHQAFSE